MWVYHLDLDFLDSSLESRSRSRLGQILVEVFIVL